MYCQTLNFIWWELVPLKFFLQTPLFAFFVFMVAAWCETELILLTLMVVLTFTAEFLHYCMLF